MSPPLKLLNIEDNAADFLLLQRHLRRHGLDAVCTRVATDTELIAAIECESWDLVISDYSLPGQEFRKLLTLLQERLPDMPVILVSGSVGEEAAVDLLKAGIWDFVLKDNLIRLVPAIERSLREAADRRARRGAEMALRDSEEKYRRLVEGLQDEYFFYQRNVDGVFTYLSPSISNVLGFRPEEFKGHYRSSLTDAPLNHQAIRHIELSLQGEQQAVYEVEVWHRDGSRRLLEMLENPLRDAGGRVVAVDGFAHDISQRKATERELAAHREHLEELVAERTAELEAARHEAERLTRVKAEFLANMSHEIRTPLNAVLGFAQVGHTENAGSKAQIHFSRILDSGELLLGIINDVLDFSKIEAGKLQVECVPLDLRFAIERAAALIAPRAAGQGLQWMVQYTDDLPAGCLGDGLRLTQILVNLLSNAVKFTEHGSIGLSAYRDGDTLIFAIRDTGLGMTAEQLARLFTAFEQADSTTTRRFGGTGLGLAISRRLAQLMGGEIRADSTPGAGSLFTLCLPYRAAEAPVRVALPASTAGPRLAGLSILVAEDNAVNRLVLEELLAPDQPRLEFVGNGRAAVDRVAAGDTAFDLILMDIQMPEMDGYEATRRILADAPTLPIIGLTAHALAEERAKILAAGMVAHLTKPVQRDELVATILNHLPVPRQTRPALSTRSLPAASAAPAEALPIDWAALDTHYGDRPAFVTKLLNVALLSNATTAAQLRVAAEAVDLPHLVFLAHSTKGMAGALYVETLRAQAALAERAARAGADDAPAQAFALATAVENLLEAIVTRLAEPLASDQA